MSDYIQFERFQWEHHYTSKESKWDFSANGQAQPILLQVYGCVVKLINISQHYYLSLIGIILILIFIQPLDTCAYQQQGVNLKEDLNK